MLDEIDNLAQQYVREESNCINREGLYVECLFKLESCRNMDLCDIAHFLTFIIDNSKETAVKISGNFICAATIYIGHRINPIPKNITFITDDREIILKFCKVKVCYKARWTDIMIHYELNNRNVVHILKK